MKKGIIFDIQRFSIHDGPGIRTVVFFKGCSLNCVWCQNPESKIMNPEIAFYAGRCIGCYKCIDLCPDGALSIDNEKRINRDLCSLCGRCSDECPAEALRIIGKYFSVNELIDEIIKDIEFYKSSNGGVTLSGGEPLLQNNFLEELLPRLNERGLNVIIETAGNYNYERIESICRYADNIYFDFKLPGDDSYMKYTGSTTESIIGTLKYLIHNKIPLTVRIPQIPGVNTEAEQINSIASVLKEIGITRVRLLKYNNLWEAKIDSLFTKQKKLGLDDKDIDYNEIIALYLSNSVLAEMN